jgi:hypothetical protein
MRKTPTTAFLALVLAACASSPAPQVSPTAASRRTPCDRFAARAIQAIDLAEASSLAAQSAACYTTLQQAQ